MTQLSGAPKPASEPVSGWIQPILIDLLVPPEVLLVDEVAEEDEDAAPWMPELQASRRAPPPTTAAPTPAARNRLRRETPPTVGWLSVLSCWAVWSVIVWDLSLI
jgi:hypothetical protein